MKIRAFGSLKNGGFFPRNTSFYLQQMKEAGNVDECVLTIEGANRRTLDQNSYAYAVFDQMAFRMNQDGWGVTSYEIYKRVENQYCITHKQHPKSGKQIEWIKPLKEHDTVEFMDIIMTARHNFMETYPDCQIDLPHQHYGLTLEAYDLWKLGKINFVEAKKMSHEKT
jgi:hypothetical protein